MSIASQPDYSGDNVTPLFEVPKPPRKGPLSKMGEYPATTGYIAVAITIILLLLIFGHR